MTAQSGIDRLYESWRDAFAKRDVDAILSLLTDDYTLWVPGAPPMHRDALGPRLRAVLETYDVVPRFERLDRFISGDVACDIGWDVQEARPRSGNAAPVAQRQRVCLVLRRGPDGVWRFARGMSQPGPADDAPRQP